MERVLGVPKIGAETVKDFGGGIGTWRRCSIEGAFFTQKCTVDFGLDGFIEEAIIPKDQPASHNARRREGTRAGSRAEINLTSSSGSFIFCFIGLLYSIFQSRTETTGGLEPLLRNGQKVRDELPLGELL